MVNVPVTEALALRISGYTREDPGFIDDAARDLKDVNSARFYGGRVAAAWQLSDNWSAKASVLAQFQKPEGSAVVDGE
jgi:iron complex outermembrane recepter protein